LNFKNDHNDRNNNNIDGDLENARSSSSTFYTGLRLNIDSPNLTETDSEIISNYEYRTTRVIRNPATSQLTVQPIAQQVTFKISKQVPRLGLMMVGWGGNNGSTLTAGILANKHSIQWSTKSGTASPNYFGSIMMATTLRIGYDQDNNEVYVPLREVLPTVDPNDLVLGGWDISKMNLAEAMDRAAVLDYDLKQRLTGMMAQMRPLPSVYYPDFIAGNQSDRADNLIPGSKAEQLLVLRQNIRDFKSSNSLDKVSDKDYFFFNSFDFAYIMPSV
jgi:myo-inositol-1-phosphate synthase